MLSVYATGQGADPQNLATFHFVGPTAIVTVSTGQVIHVSAQKGLGTILPSATGMRLAICRRVAGSGAVPTDDLDWITNVAVTANVLIPFALTKRFSGLPAGSWEVGLCTAFPFLTGNQWNFNSEGRVWAMVTNS